MKVLLLFPMADGQTGPAIKYAFEKLGHEVMAVDAKLNPHKSHDANLLFEPDLLFCSRTPALIYQVEIIKQDSPKIITCCWNVDTRNAIEEWIPLFPLIQACDYYFVVAKRLIPEWQKLNKNTYWLPQGLQNEVYHKPDKLTDEDRKTFECDVSFAGSCTGYHAWRIPYLDAIEKMGVKFRVWGCEEHSQIYNEDHNKMVSLSKINIGLSGWPENGRYVSVRDYKILGAGGFLLELYRDGLFDIFPINTLATFTTVADLCDLIEASLENGHTREKIANNGHDYVHSQATYTHRIQRALEIMGLK